MVGVRGRLLFIRRGRREAEIKDVEELTMENKVKEIGFAEEAFV